MFVKVNVSKETVQNVGVNRNYGHCLYATISRIAAIPVTTGQLYNTCLFL